MKAVPEEGRHVTLNKAQSSQVAGSGTSLPEAKSLALSPRSPSDGQPRAQHSLDGTVIVSLDNLK